MPNPKLATFSDAFTGAAINTTLWNSITGTATLDTTNDLVTLAQPTVSGTTNSFGTTSLYDATGSSIYAQIAAVPNGAGTTKTALVLRVDANNSVAIRVESGIFKMTLQTAGTTATTTLPPYDPHAHRWWRIRENSGTWYADTAPDGITWTQQTSSTYSWGATAMTAAIQTSAGATEVAGLVATIAHINTPLGGTANPNWPTLEHGWGAYWDANGGDIPLDRYVEVTNRTRGTTTTRRGRQYELDQVRAGELTTRLANTDAALDPTNSSGPWYGRIAPYQPYRLRAQWPPTRNLLDQVHATGGDLGGWPLGTVDGSGVGPDIFSVTDSTNGAIVAATDAWQGGRVLQFAVPSGSTAPTRIAHTPRFSAIPGQTYTMQMQVRNITASTSLSVQAFVGWYMTAGASATSFTYGTTTTLTGSTTAGWTQLTVTATAPTGAMGIDVGVAVAVTAAATCSVQVDGWQLEKGATASSWTVPGVWYPIYSGYVERFSPEWEMSGTYGTVNPTCVDALALLSRVLLTDILTQQLSLAAFSPRFLFPLSDPSGSTTFVDRLGVYPAAKITKSKNGAGSVAPGTQITATDTVNGIFTGSGGATVTTITNPSPGVGAVVASSVIDLTTSGIVGPANPAEWTRAIAFRYTGPLPSDAACIWSCMDRQHAPTGALATGSRIFLSVSSTGKLVLVIGGPTNVEAVMSFTANDGSVPSVNDGNWHWALFAYDAANAQARVSLDGNNWFYTGLSSAITPTGLVSDSIGAWYDLGLGGAAGDNFQGDVAFAAEWPVWFNNADNVAIYSAWKNSLTGDPTNFRYTRILGWCGYTGAWNAQAGLTTSMGPASFSGQDVVTALQAVVETENGEHFVSRDGTLTFRPRSARYNATTPVLIFGERTDLGEYPYEDCKMDYDPTRLANQITVTQTGTGQTFTANDKASITRYFPSTLTRSVNASSALECQDAASYLLSRYKAPATRVSAIKLNPASNPALWPVMLSLELGSRVRVMRRPPGVPAITVDCFVEAIDWQLDDTAGAAVTLQLSPADLTPYGIFASFHTTLNGSPASGVTSITINAGADTTNLASQQLWPGQQLVLGQGSANQETVTIGSVGATSPGWTTATVTLTGATTKSHTNGDTVCEPLPAGTTDPTAWDAVSAFDAIAFAY
ncbi:hypothetical protein [Streptomyces sp. CBMA152]|uniref:hypothetical protein n=1 Tax=Streptomyces sp. CBMA152 TaxID=1896312 RepID=UPI0016602237|nr:hypothetical protein [Streptomyces sp. CBMA152]MBD0743608.1 hypothetical protein [Streptomyces sp. CBMA152]